jgi:hypothetical protein
VNSLRHRLIGLPALVLSITVAGCSSADDGTASAVPSPGAKALGLCESLD